MEEGGGCESDLTSTPVEMYWLSPPVGLRLKVRKIVYFTVINKF